MKTLPLFCLGLVLTAGCATTHDSKPATTDTAATNVVIISATYGSGVDYADVTQRVDGLLRLPQMKFFARPEWLDADPTPGWNKALVILYEFQGKRHIFSTGEGGKVSMTQLIDNANAPPKKADHAKDSNDDNPPPDVPAGFGT